MTQWEYLEIDLSATSKDADEVDLLTEAGAEGWELVTIVPPYRAILKRPVKGPTDRRPRRRLEGKADT
ncbi:MAG: hypothetical protein NW223_23985 [Hyphomicrobiaceae bacterium]|nr:hypothetical protein [Hyphomicrobiaceae bacterium]